MTAQARYDNAAYYSAVRCPVHGRVVAIVDGKLAGRCDGCVVEVALGFKRLKRMRGRA